MNPLRPSARLQVTGAACLLLALFGGGWMVLALDAQSLLWLLTCAFLPASLLALRSISLLHAGSLAAESEPAPTAAEFEASATLRRRFSLALAAELGAIVLAANLLNGAGHPDAIVAAVAAIVAVFLLPQAALFGIPQLYWTGAVELALVVTLAGMLRDRLMAADPFLGLTMSLTLWLTAIVLLARSRRIRPAAGS